MKAIFAALLSFVLFASQCFAIKGGPVYPGAEITTTGNYAGVFVPTSQDNSLGIFSTSIPTTGLGTGTVAFFRNGIFYPGTIQAVVDPDSAALTGVVDSSFDVTFTSTTNGTTGTTNNVVITFNASGRIDAHVRANTNAFSTASARLVGTAGITYATVGTAPGFDSSTANSDGPIAYEVDGFKQSEALQ